MATMSSVITFTGRPVLHRLKGYEIILLTLLLSKKLLKKINTAVPKDLSTPLSKLNHKMVQDLFF